MFIRTKRIGKQDYYYLVKSYLRDGKPRQKVIRYIGKVKPTPEELQQIINEVRA